MKTTLFIFFTFVSILTLMTYGLKDEYKPDLSQVPVWLWWMVGLGSYLLLMWGFVGPSYTRKLARSHYEYGDPPLEVRWFFAPIWMPLIPVWKFFTWLIYGTIK
jgi:hypothetical protein